MKALCQFVADNNHFQSFILFLILMTAAVMGMETSPTLADEYGDFFVWFACISQGLFLLEIVIRIIAAPSIRAFFQGGWNKFDFTVVALSLIPAIGPMALIARLARVLRVLRLFSTSKRLKTFVESLHEACDEILYAFIVVLVLGYIYAVSGYYLFVDITPAHWGDLGRAGMSVFYLLLLQDVPGFVEPLIAASAWSILYFILFYLTFAGLFIGVLTAAITNSNNRKND